MVGFTADDPINVPARFIAERLGPGQRISGRVQPSRNGTSRIK
jgi:hypothetical protein